MKENDLTEQQLLEVIKKSLLEALKSGAIIHNDIQVNWMSKYPYVIQTNRKLRSLDEFELRQLTESALAQVMNEMVFDKRAFVFRCDHVAEKIYTNLAKICIFEHTPEKHCSLKYWRDIIYDQIYALSRIKLEDEEQACGQRRRCYRKGLIEFTLEDDYSEYKEIQHYFLDALEDEGYYGARLDIVPYKRITMKNKQRICTFLDSLVETLLIEDDGKRQIALRSLIDNF